MASPTSGQYKAGQKDPEVSAKWAKALDLRRAGKSYQVIADAVGYADPSGAYRAVMDALAATLREPAEDVRKLELERLDKLMSGLWDKATDEADPDYDALDRVLKIMDRRAKLLGIDAPTKADITSDGKPLGGGIKYVEAVPPQEVSANDAQSE